MGFLSSFRKPSADDPPPTESWPLFAFGKLPVYKDFISAGLTDDASREFRDWLSNGFTPPLVDARRLPLLRDPAPRVSAPSAREPQDGRGRPLGKHGPGRAQEIPVRSLHDPARREAVCVRLDGARLSPGLREPRPGDPAEVRRGRHAGRCVPGSPRIPYRDSGPPAEADPAAALGRARPLARRSPRERTLRRRRGDSMGRSPLRPRRRRPAAHCRRGRVPIPARGRDVPARPDEALDLQARAGLADPAPCRPAFSTGSEAWSRAAFCSSATRGPRTSSSSIRRRLRPISSRRSRRPRARRGSSGRNRKRPKPAVGASAPSPAAVAPAAAAAPEADIRLAAAARDVPRPSRQSAAPSRRPRLPSWSDPARSRRQTASRPPFPSRLPFRSRPPCRSRPLLRQTPAIPGPLIASARVSRGPAWRSRADRGFRCAGRRGRGRHECRPPPNLQRTPEPVAAETPLAVSSEASPPEPPPSSPPATAEPAGWDLPLASLLESG